VFGRPGRAPLRSRSGSTGSPGVRPAAARRRPRSSLARLLLGRDPHVVRRVRPVRRDVHPAPVLPSDHGRRRAGLWVPSAARRRRDARRASCCSTSWLIASGRSSASHSGSRSSSWARRIGSTVARRAATRPRGVVVHARAREPASALVRHVGGLVNSTPSGAVSPPRSSRRWSSSARRSAPRSWGSVLNSTYGAQSVSGLPTSVAAAVRASVLGGLGVAQQLGSSALAASARTSFVAGLVTRCAHGRRDRGCHSCSRCSSCPHGHGPAGAAEAPEVGTGQVAVSKDDGRSGRARNCCAADPRLDVCDVMRLCSIARGDLRGGIHLNREGSRIRASVRERSPSAGVPERRPGGPLGGDQWIQHVRPTHPS